MKRRKYRIKDAIWVRVDKTDTPNFDHAGLPASLIFHDEHPGDGPSYTYAYWFLSEEIPWKEQERLLRLLCVLYGGHTSVAHAKFEHPKTAVLYHQSKLSAGQVVHEEPGFRTQVD